jgi:polysaccharide pyruvyl transferase WcaK-like protein
LTLTETRVAAGDAAAPMARRLRIGVFGGFGIGNFGNDASLEAMLLFLREAHPEAELTVICTKPDVVEARFGLPAVPLFLRPSGRLRYLDLALLRLPRTVANWRHTLKALRRFDVVLAAGTGVFDDFRDTPFGWPSRLMRWTLAARLAGVRFGFVSVGAGPIRNPISCWLMREAARLAHHRSYRDEDSRSFMRSIGLNRPQDSVLPDLAFLLPPPAEAPRAPDAPLTVGVGIMTYRGWFDSEAAYQRYIDLHTRFIEWLTAQGYGVRAVIGQAPADFTAAREIEERLGRKLLGPREENMSSIHDAMAAIAETDLVVASRYHVQIAALKMGRPLISLGYAPKNDALMADVGLERFIENVDEVTFERLTEQFTALAAERDHYAAIVRDRVEAMSAHLKAALRGLDLLPAKVA